MPLGRRSLRFALAGLTVTALASALALVSAARADERTSVESVLAGLNGDAAHKAATAELVAHAREALERATRLRTAGDETHAKLADGLAREHADAARDLARAIDAEEKATAARRAAIDAGAQVERERALLEEGIAQNGRLRAALDELERGRKEAPLKTNAAGAAADAGVKALPAPATKPGALGVDGGAK
jgi:hypothetical protein